MQTYEQIEWEIIRFEGNDAVLTSDQLPPINLPVV